MSIPSLISPLVRLNDDLTVIFNSALTIRQANNLCALFRDLLVQPEKYNKEIKHWLVTEHGELFYKGTHIGLFGYHESISQQCYLVNQLNGYESTPRELEALAASNQSYGQPAVIH